MRIRNKKIGTKVTITCPNCDGTGIDPNDGQKCKDCDGSGTVQGVVTQ